MIKYITALFLFVFGSSARGQEVQPLLIQFDKPLYTTGETVWFGVLRTDSATYDSKEVLHFELLSPGNANIINGKVLIDGRLAQGYFRLPSNLDEGFYRFRAFTIKSLKSGGNYILANLPIYSEWKEDLKVYKYEENPENTEDQFSEEDIQIDKKSHVYSRRDTVSFTDIIPNTNEEWQYIFWAQPGDYEKFAQIKPVVGKIPTSLELYSDLIIEDSLYFEANLNQLGSDVGVSSPLISIYSGNDKRFYRSKATEGKLSLKIPYFDGETTLQVFNLNPYQDAVSKLNVRQWTINKGYFNSSKPVITHEIADYLIKAKQRRKVNDLFSSSENSLNIASPDSVLAIPDASYTMSEYKSITDLRDFIYEAIPGAKLLTEDDGSVTARLFNPERRSTFVDRPWYIVDGYLTSREQEVLKIPFNDIDEIKLYVHTATIRKYFEYFLWRNGIMEIRTKDVKYKRSLKTDPNYTDFAGLEPKIDFLQSINPISDNKIPDLRTTMYWETGKWTAGHSNIQFPLSDDTGNFTYHLIAVSSSGKTIRKQGSFKIR